MNIVELGLESPQITADSQLSLPPIPLVDTLEEVVVGRVAIGELVHKNGICRKLAPVDWGRGIGGIGALAVILENTLCISVNVEIPTDKVFAIRGR